MKKNNWKCGQQNEKGTNKSTIKISKKDQKVNKLKIYKTNHDKRETQ